MKGCRTEKCGSFFKCNTVLSQRSHCTGTNAYSAAVRRFSGETFVCACGFQDAAHRTACKVHAGTLQARNEKNCLHIKRGL